MTGPVMCRVGVCGGAYKIEFKPLKGAEDMKLPVILCEEDKEEDNCIRVKVKKSFFAVSFRDCEKSLAVSQGALNHAKKEGMNSLFQILVSQVSKLEGEINKRRPFFGKNFPALAKGTLGKVILTVERNREEWQKAPRCQQFFNTSPTQFFKVATLKEREPVILFQNVIEKGTCKKIRNGYHYSSGMPMAWISKRKNIRQDNSWENEVRISYALLKAKTDGAELNGVVPIYAVISMDPLSLNPDHKIILQKKCQGDLFKLLQEKGLTDDQKLYTAVCAAQGLYCLHRLQIYHGDVKLENILIDNASLMWGKKKLKTSLLADFNLAGFFTDEKRKVGGTYGYLSPELFKEFLNGNTYSKTDPEKNDCWMFGIVLFILVLNQFPHVLQLQKSEAAMKQSAPAKNRLRSYFHEEVKRINRLSSFSRKPACLSQVLLNLLKQNPLERWSMDKVFFALLDIFQSKNSKRGFGDPILPRIDYDPDENLKYIL